jgi:phospholipase D1/2
VLAILALCFVVGCIWRFTPLYHRFGFHTLVHWATLIRGHPWTPFGVILAFVLGGLVFFVHALLLWVTVFTFDPLHAFIYCELGSMASALVVYGLGRVLRQDVVRRLAGSYMESISHALARRAILTLILLHVFPVCPYSVLNLLAGATHISFRDYVVGTFFGITPGLIVICIFGNRLMDIIHRPHPINIVLLALFVLVGIFVFFKARQRLLPKTLE